MFILTEQEILDAIKNCHDADFRMALIRMLIPPAPKLNIGIVVQNVMEKETRRAVFVMGWVLYT